MVTSRGGSMLCSTDLVEKWRHTQQAYLADTSAVLAYQALDQQRLQVQQEMMQLLDAFLKGSITLPAFNTLFQQKTHGVGNVFHMRGMSGGMFLNKLIKYVRDGEMLTALLRSSLRLPQDTREGQHHMQALSGYLNQLITLDVVTRSQLQPTRVPFLLSAWWHLQNPRQWPIFFPLVYYTLCDETKQVVLQNPIKTYFAFRTQFVSLARALGISLWELEHIVTWQGQQRLDRQIAKKMMRSSSYIRGKSMVIQPEAVHTPLIDAEENALCGQQEKESDDHTRIQWLLAKIGYQVGCDVWIAANDHSKVWNGERLGDLSMKTLPLLGDGTLRRMIHLIDVLWLQGEKVIAAYEVEHTTSISSGLLRLYDLDTLCPTHTIYLCVIVPHPHLKRMQTVLARPAFQQLNMDERCMIIQEENLLEHGEHILRWASSPAVITRLALNHENMVNYRLRG